MLGCGTGTGTEEDGAVVPEADTVGRAAADAGAEGETVWVMRAEEAADVSERTAPVSAEGDVDSVREGGAVVVNPSGVMKSESFTSTGISLVP